MKKSILYISTNNFKITELEYINSKIFPYYEIKLKFVNHFQKKKLMKIQKIIEDVEDGICYEENAYKKAIFYSELFNCDVLVEDSGLDVPQLKNENLGVNSKHWNSHLNQEDINALLMKIVAKEFPNKQIECSYTSCLCYYNHQKKDYKIFIGVLKGFIANSSNYGGKEGFGFDPIFLIDYYNEIIPLAKLSFIEKNNISHRAIAYRQFCQWYTNKK